MAAMQWTGRSHVLFAVLGSIPEVCDACIFEERRRHPSPIGPQLWETTASGVLTLAWAAIEVRTLSAHTMHTMCIPVCSSQHALLLSLPGDTLPMVHRDPGWELPRMADMAAVRMV